MADDHAAKIERAFSQQAAAFEDRRFNRIFTSDADWLFRHVGVGPDAMVLDVAAGTGHAGRSLAPAVRSVVALDATVAMLRTGKRAAEEAGLRNVVFLRGDAAALPFLDGSFDVVISRYAVHHFEEPSVPVAEMARCVRPGGQLVVADLISSDDAAIAAAQNELERLRDPSHTRMLGATELVELVARVADVATVETRDVVRALDPWLAQTQAPEEVVDRITGAFRAELRGGPLTGMQPADERGELRFLHTLRSVTARTARRP